MNKVPGFAVEGLVLDVDGRRLDATAIDVDGSVLDEFTIVKGPYCPPGTDPDEVSAPAHSMG